MRLRCAVLRQPRDGWPAGTRGTIVEAFENAAMIEISDDEGVMLDMLTLPYSALSITGPSAGA
jgi:hypothetical protein